MPTCPTTSVQPSPLGVDLERYDCFRSESNRLLLIRWNRIRGRRGPSCWRDCPTDPICSYGIVKLAAEKYLGMYRHLYGLKPLVLRPSNPFGPRQGHEGVQGFIATCLGRLHQNAPVEVWGDGSVVRDYLYVADLALAAVLGIESAVSGVVNVASGEGRSLLEVIASITAVSGLTPRVEFREGRVFDVPHLVLANARAEAVLGWKPTTTFEDGIAAHWAWLDSTQRKRPVSAS